MDNLGNKELTPAQAWDLVQQGAIYLDVRAADEFLEGHAPGAVNIAYAARIQGKLLPRSEFLAEVQARFSTHTKLVVACAAGGRSAKAVQLLAQAGYSQLWNMPAGWDGKRDAFGTVLTPGWKLSGLPTV